jgi:hypothetical protein
MARAWSSLRIIGKLEFISWVYLIPSFSSGYPSTDHLSIFEIYPQSEIPLLTEIYLHRFPSEDAAHWQLLPDTLLFRAIHEDRIVFRVVDYRTNYSTCFSVDVELKNIISLNRDVEVIFCSFQNVEVSF